MSRPMRWGALKTLPEAVRDKKEIQLELNLAEIMESLGDDLIKRRLRYGPGGNSIQQIRGD